MTSPADFRPPQNPPVVLSAAQRHDLAVQFERAKQLARQSPPDFAGAHQLLSQCCTLDPGNTHFLAILLKNLQLATAPVSRSWPWQRWQRRRQLVAARRAKELGIALAHGWFLLGENPEDAPLLLELAEIEAELDHYPATVQLLQEADRIAPRQPETLRRLGIALGENGAFEQAARIWQALAEISPEDEQAKQLLQLLTKPEPAEPDADLTPAEQIAEYLRQRQWQAAAAVLEHQLKTAGADLRLESFSGEIAVGQAREKTDLAREMNRLLPSARAAQVVETLLVEQRRIELGVAYARYERFPAEPESSWELAQCLARSGNYSEALKYLTPLAAQKKWRTRALIAAGENLQHLRQFDRALAAYREALDQPDLDPQEEPVQRGWHRAAVLAEAAGLPGEALAWLERLTAANPAYKDARARLDNLRLICNKGGFSAGPK